MKLIQRDLYLNQLILSIITFEVLLKPLKPINKIFIFYSTAFQYPVLFEPTLIINPFFINEEIKR